MTRLFISGTRSLVSSLASFTWPARRELPQVEAQPDRAEIPVPAEWAGSSSGEVNTISAQVSGYLFRQHYHEGQTVKQGELLFELDDRAFQAALEQALARLRRTELEVQRLQRLAASGVHCQPDLDHAIQANLDSRADADAAHLNLQFTRITSPVDGIAGLALVQIGNRVGPGSGPLTTVTARFANRPPPSTDLCA